MTRPEPERDSYGRYRLPDPTTGRKRSYTRTTTLAKCMADTTALDRWKQRMVAKGLTLRPDLADVVAMTELDDRDTLDAMCSKALEAAGGGAGAAAGTTLHTLTEEVDSGERKLTDVPEEFAADVRAYVYALGDAGIEIIPEHIERIIVNPALEVAGTYDRLVRLPDGRLVVGDLKTQKDLTYGLGDIAIQLAIYANAPVVWDWDAEDWEPMPAELDRTAGLIIHLPVGKGVCTLHEIDLTAGWQAALLAADVKRWRGRRGLARLYEPPVPLPVRIEAAGSIGELEALWRANRAAWNAEATAAASRRKAALLDAA